MPLFHSQSSDAGSLKLTIQKFYRVSGGSTQHRGVISDIVIPSTTDTPEIGEGSLPNPLAYDEVDPQTIKKFNFTAPFIDSLRQHSEARVAKEPEFHFIQEDMKILRQRLDQNVLSLSEKVRKEELAKEKARKKERVAERKKNPVVEPVAYEVTLDTVDKPVLPLVTAKKKQDKKVKEATPKISNDGEDQEDDSDTAAVAPDPIRHEAINILQDFTSLLHSVKTAGTNHDQQ
jgi:carboxyl-terminal processing protease